jgi:hypothetical protein
MCKSAERGLALSPPEVYDFYEAARDFVDGIEKS